jgi:hypothetical protein
VTNKESLIHEKLFSQCFGEICSGTANVDFQVAQHYFWPTADALGIPRCGVGIQ